MPNLLQDGLADLGFSQIRVSMDGVGLYIRPENNLINALLILDNEKVPYPSTSDLDLLREKVREWIGAGSPNGDVPNIHILTILRSGDVDRNRELSQSEQMLWFADPFEKHLFVYENQISDFYGVRSVIERAAEEDLMGAAAAKERTEGDAGRYGQRSGSFETRDERGFDFFSRLTLKIKEEGIGSIPYVTTGIVLLNILVLLFNLFWFHNLNELGAVGAEVVLQDGEYYRLITSLFLHSGINHLFGNMILFGYTGRYMEGRIGHFPLFILYLGSGMMGSFFSIGADLFVLHDNHCSIGASGAVFGIIGAMIVITLVNGGWTRTINPRRIASVAILMLYSGFSDASIDNSAHLGGLLGGMLIMSILWLFGVGRRRKQNEN